MSVMDRHVPTCDAFALWTMRSVCALLRGTVQDTLVASVGMKRRAERDVEDRIARQAVFPVDQGADVLAVREQVVIAQIAMEQTRVFNRQHPSGQFKNLADTL